MPRATRTKNVSQEHQDTATMEARPRKVRAPKKGAERRSDTGQNGPEEDSYKGPEGPEEGRTFPHLTTMPLQSWGKVKSFDRAKHRGAESAVDRLSPTGLTTC